MIWKLVEYRGVWIISKVRGRDVKQCGNALNKINALIKYSMSCVELEQRNKELEETVKEQGVMVIVMALAGMLFGCLVMLTLFFFYIYILYISSD